MYKVFILLFIILIINYFLFEFKETYLDFENIPKINLCNSGNSIKNINNIFKNQIIRECEDSNTASSEHIQGSGQGTASPEHIQGSGQGTASSEHIQGSGQGTASPNLNQTNNKCFTPTGEAGMSVWKCPSDDNKTIPCHYVCDGYDPADCPNGEDEATDFCENWVRPTLPSTAIT
jgi:hypothetical protein